MKKVMFVLIFFLITFMWVPGWIYGDISNDERNALISLYNKTGGSNWNKKKNWKGAPGTEQNWYGITCDASKTTVLKIELPGNNLKGELPYEIDEFLNINTLDLRNNQLTGKIPSGIKKLKNLKKLDLSGNQFYGPIPSWIGSLKNLEELRLDDNRLEGPIPGELGNLSKLKVLKLAGNRLTGEIPAELGKLNKLSNAGSDFKWNGLYTENEDLKKFLRQKQIGGDWESTQTVVPLDIRMVGFTEDTITIRWEPIRYTGNTGGYKVIYWLEGKPDGKKSILIKNKKVAEVTLNELEGSTTYYYRINSWTDSHRENKNRIESLLSDELPAATRGLIISGTVTTIDKKPFQGLKIQASNNGGTVDVSEDGTYKLEVMPGWKGRITPSKVSYKFSPSYREYPPIKADQIHQDYEAEVITVISGKVTYNWKGIEGVELTFSSSDKKDKEEIKLNSVKTRPDGSYKKIVPYEWTGTITPQKDGHQFAPELGKIDPVTSPQEKNFSAKFPFISGRVTDRKNKGISGVKLHFSYDETRRPNYLEEYVATDENGHYANDIPTNWSGRVIPQKKRYVFYPAEMGNLTGQEPKSDVNFKIERDFKFFVLITGNYMLPSEDRFGDIYGSGILYPEFTIGFKFFRNYYLWGNFGFFSKSGKAAGLENQLRRRQQSLSLGVGYYRYVSPAFDWKFRVGLMAVKYREVAFGDEVSSGVLGLMIEGGGVYKINDQLFMEISMGYQYAKSTIEGKSINPVGLKGGLGLGFRF